MNTILCSLESSGARSFSGWLKMYWLMVCGSSLTHTKYKLKNYCTFILCYRFNREFSFLLAGSPPYQILTRGGFPKPCSSGRTQSELDHTKVDRMCTSLTSSALPALEQYFGHPLFLWMDRKLWRVRLYCPHSDCCKSDLISAGLH